MAVSEKELAEQLMQAGKRLLTPPSVDELLSLLDELQHCLEGVEQSPSKTIQDALSPSMKALVANELLGHLDPDVKVSVATCISEITRITAPDSPYNDDQMKEIFRLIVSSFEELYDKSNRSYNKRASILETVAKVRSCLLMLDLECDALVLEMFRHFLKSVRDYHPEDVFSSMETIMTLVLEESEDIPPELLSSMLLYLKRDNNDVQPIAQKLAEKVLVKCAAKVQPYLLQAFKSLGISLNDYKEVVANVCQASSGAAEPNNMNVGNYSADQDDLHKLPSEGTIEEAKETPEGSAPPTEVSPTMDSATDKLKCAMSNGDLQKAAEASKESRGQENDDHVETKAAEELSQGRPDDAELIVKLQRKSNRKRGKKGPPKSTSDATEVAPAEEDKGSDKVSDHHERESKDIRSLPQDDTTADAKVDGDKKIDGRHPSPKTSEKEAMDVSSPSPSGHLPEESRSKKVGRGKKKESKVQKGTLDLGNASKKEDESTSDLDSKSTKQLGQKAEPATYLSDDKRRRGKGKAVSRKDLTKKSSKDEAKESNSSPKSAAKSAKRETPALSSKRKRAADKEKASETGEYGKDLVGSKIKVWWPDDQQFYEGVVDSYDQDEMKHKIAYVDGDVEVLNLKMEEWEFVKGDVDSDKGNVNDDRRMGASPEIHRKKKAKSNLDSSSKKGKSGSSAKKGGRGASSSKAKATASKPGRKRKAESKVDKKSKDDSSKSTDGAKDENAAKSRESKGGKDSVDEVPKGGAKSKDSDIATPLGSTKSKQETDDKSTKSKGKSTKAGGSSSNANGATKSKAGSSSKGKEAKKAKKSSPESAKSGEAGKVKSPSASKVEKSGTKVGRKRQRGT